MRLKQFKTNAIEVHEQETEAHEILNNLKHEIEAHKRLKQFKVRVINTRKTNAV